MYSSWSKWCFMSKRYRCGVNSVCFNGIHEDLADTTSMVQGRLGKTQGRLGKTQGQEGESPMLGKTQE